ncbi:MAG TPA: hypothetical protein VEK11_00440 [Thermoanaerobaculia bacterium]|nr:hypothetical protein [Thermoanaerobaculia bacterium]
MPQIDPLWIWIALGALAVLIVVGLIARGARRGRTESLREKFGNEYDHAVQQAGNRKRAEQELIARTHEVKKYNVVPLSASDRERFRADWQRVERHFLERPTTAVVEADELVADIMRVRGYPMGDFDRHAADLSVTHPSVIEHYRAGHKVIEGAAPGSASTEDLRQAMLHYRSLFDELIDDRIGNDVVADVPRANEVAHSPRRRASPHTTPSEERDVSR